MNILTPNNVLFESLIQNNRLKNNVELFLDFLFIKRNRRNIL